MLSNPLHRFSPYHNLQQPNLLNSNHVLHNSLRNNNLHSMNQSSPYNLHHLHVNPTSPHLARSHSQPKQRQHPYGSQGRTGGVGGPIRRRISRACDQCNQLRTKCDGQHPCAHCIEFGLSCEYARERKKRGKASRKDLAAQAAVEASQGDSKSDDQDTQSGNDDESQTISTRSTRQAMRRPRNLHALSAKKNIDNVDSTTLNQHAAQQETLETLEDMTTSGHLSGHPNMERSQMEEVDLDLNSFGNVHHGYERQDLGGHIMNDQHYGPSQGNVSAYPDLPYTLSGQSPTNFTNSGGFRLGNSPMPPYGMGAAPSPGWGVAFPSPIASGQCQPLHMTNSNMNRNSIRYPVLEPLLPHLGSILPTSLACDLIDVYFSSSSSAMMHPMSPYVLGFIFRKRAFLHPSKPRQCQPALLASMLWVAAQTSDAPFLTSVPSARGKTCRKLLDLTVGLLNPLIHTPSGVPSPGSSPAAVDGVALGGLGVALPGTISKDALTGEFGAFGAAGNLDDLATYIHLATVVSASEYKGASLRWWNAAWSLARELKLGRELPPSTPPLDLEQNDYGEGFDEHDTYRNTSGLVTEEEREERRRIWWLVYIVDRHLALCYNRPLFLLDIECDGLLRPMNDTAWQRGDFSNFPSTTDPMVLNPLSKENKARGPSFECQGHSIFGYFLPLMAILGEIVDLHHARNHPRFGVCFRSSREWEEQSAEITRHLETYEHSLKRFEQRHLPKQPEDKGDHNENNEHLGAEVGTPSVHSAHTNASIRMTEIDIQARIVIAYGTHVVHVLYILLAGKWDPINLIDDEDLWISSEGFITATSHAVSAAEAINHILEFDPGLEFMPFFFGIYLLQGSFLLLLIADKLQVEASPSVVRACETIVRAHEACVVTLSTEYQRNFSKVMRSALAQIRGRVPEDLHEQQQRRRELLALYRWTGDGTGLAL